MSNKLVYKSIPYFLGSENSNLSKIISMSMIDSLNMNNSAAAHA
jgi:hypothetical protein